MNRWFIVLFGNYEYKDPSIFPEVIRFFEKWNSKNELKFEISDHSCKAKLPYDQLNLAFEFEKIARENKWRGGVMLLHNYTDDDYRKSDYINVLGASLNDKFYKEEENPYSNYPVCVQCHMRLITCMKFENPFIFDESYTKKPKNGEKQKPKVQWDFITIGYYSGLFISKRAVDFFQENKIKGYNLAEVTDKKTGQPSKNYFHLHANVVFKTDCDKHTLRKKNTSACNYCGYEIESDKLSEPFFNKNEVKENDIFVHNILPYGRTYISNRLYKLISKSELEGLEAIDIASLCEHS